MVKQAENGKGGRVKDVMALEMEKMWLCVRS